VPDTHAPVGSYGLVEAPPSGKVRDVRVAREALEVFEGLSVLDQRCPRPIEELLGSEETLLRVFLQFAKHRNHIPERLEPLPHLQGAIYAHAYDKDDEGFFDVSGEPTRYYPSHERTS
jgi:hypothetical protein